GSSQIAELSAVIRAFQLFPEPLNIVSDSAYVVGVVRRIENSYIKDLSQLQLPHMFKTLWYEISQSRHKFHIIHIRSHTSLPGPIAEENRVADEIAATGHLAQTAVVPNNFEKAKLSHSFFHQNIKSLTKTFNLTLSEARTILSACPNCQRLTPLPSEGVNPRGINPLDIWQSDITHYAPFGKLKYIRVSIDTCSGVIAATAQSGEKARDVKKHFMSAISILGIPKTVKTDNGPAYTSQSLKEFFNMWGITHVTGIPHSPTSQAIVERAHHMLKNMLTKQQ
ncbi:hypothetical protein N305_02255, partial [Manacus vitellinus]